MLTAPKAIFLLLVSFLFSFVRPAYAGQSVSFSWLSYDELIENENDQAEFEPNEYQFLYANDIYENYTLSLRYWQAEDTTQFIAGVDLEREFSGWQVALARTINQDYDRSLWIELSIGSSESSIESISTLANSGYMEDTESQEAGLAVGYDLELEDWLFSSSLQFVYQESKAGFFRERLGLLSDLDFDTELQGTFAQADLGATYYVDLSNETLLGAGLFFSWVEGLSGDGIARAQGSTFIRSRNINRTFDLEDDLEAEIDSAGSISFQTSLFYGASDAISYGLDASVTEPIDQEGIGTQIQIGVSVYF